MPVSNTPPIPPVPRPGQNQEPFLRALRDTVQLRAGLTNNFLDSSPTIRQLVRDDLLEVSGYDSNGQPTTFRPGAQLVTTITQTINEVVGETPFDDVTVPSAPTGLTVSSTPFNNFLTWNIPAGVTNTITAYTEVWAHSSDVRASATFVGIANTAFVHSVEPNSTTYYWVRFRSYNNVAGLWSGTAGVVGTTPSDPAALLTLLNGAITESQLTSYLNSRVIEPGSAFTETWSHGDEAQAELVWNEVLAGDLADLSTIITGSFPGSSFALEVGDNSGNDRLWAGVDRRLALPVQPNSLYRISGYFRRTLGSGVIYFGVNGFAGDYQNGNGVLYNRTGDNLYTDQFYFALSNHSPVDTDWFFADAYFVSGATYEFNAGTVADPHVLPAGVEAVAPMFIVNHSAAAGTTAVSRVRLEQVGGTEITNTVNRYGVKIDANGYVTGYGLLLTENNGTPTSEFQIAVDSFSIRSPGATSLAFAVADGSVVMDGAFIQNATITDAAITNLTAEKITTGTLNLNRLNLDGITLANVGGELQVNSVSWDTHLVDIPDNLVEIYYQTTAPLAPNVNDMWVDTDNGNLASRWNGVSWVSLQDASIQTALDNAATAQNTADGKIVSFAQASAPTAEGVGDIWIDTDNGNRIYRWTGASWVDMRDGGITQALNDASTAQATADGKIQSFYQTTAPGGGDLDAGDLWIDTNDNNRLYRYSGSAWIDIRDGTISTAQNTASSAIASAATAQATADGKVTTFVGINAPTAEGVGDIWMDTGSNNAIYRWSGSAWVAYEQDYAAWGNVSGVEVATGDINFEAVTTTQVATDAITSIRTTTPVNVVTNTVDLGADVSNATVVLLFTSDLRIVGDGEAPGPVGEYTVEISAYDHGNNQRAVQQFTVTPRLNAAELVTRGEGASFRTSAAQTIAHGGTVAVLTQLGTLSGDDDHPASLSTSVASGVITFTEPDTDFYHITGHVGLVKTQGGGVGHGTLTVQRNTTGTWVDVPGCTALPWSIPESGASVNGTTIPFSLHLYAALNDQIRLVVTNNSAATNTVRADADATRVNIYRPTHGFTDNFRYYRGPIANVFEIAAGLVTGSNQFEIRARVTSVTNSTSILLDDSKLLAFVRKR